MGTFNKLWTTGSYFINRNKDDLLCQYIIFSYFDTDGIIVFKVREALNFKNRAWHDSSDLLSASSSLSWALFLSLLI